MLRGLSWLRHCRACRGRRRCGGSAGQNCSGCIANLLLLSPSLPSRSSPQPQHSAAVPHPQPTLSFPAAHHERVGAGGATHLARVGAAHQGQQALGAGHGGALEGLLVVEGLAHVLLGDLGGKTRGRGRRRVSPRAASAVGKSAAGRSRTHGGVTIDCDAGQNKHAARTRLSRRSACSGCSAASSARHWSSVRHTASEAFFQNRPMSVWYSCSSRLRWCALRRGGGKQSQRARASGSASTTAVQESLQHALLVLKPRRGGTCSWRSRGSRPPHPPPSAHPAAG